MVLTKCSNFNFGCHFEARFPRKKIRQFWILLQKLPTENHSSRDVVYQGAWKFFQGVAASLGFAASFVLETGLRSACPPRSQCHCEFLVRGRRIIVKFWSEISVSSRILLLKSHCDREFFVWNLGVIADSSAEVWVPLRIRYNEAFASGIGTSRIFSNNIVSFLQCTSRDLVRQPYLTRNSSANWFNFDWACQPCQHNEAFASRIGTSRIFSNGIVSFL